jgi:hypothetical protein
MKKINFPIIVNKADDFFNKKEGISESIQNVQPGKPQFIHCERRAGKTSLIKFLSAWIKRDTDSLHKIGEDKSDEAKSTID